MPSTSEIVFVRLNKVLHTEFLMIERTVMQISKYCNAGLRTLVYDKLYAPMTHFQ